MRRALLAAALLAVAGSTAAGQSPALSRDTLVMVDRVFAKYSTRTPGCAVGVARDGHEVLARAYGMAELEHGATITPETIFEAGSVSKQFTAFLTLLLEQDGKLSLDDPMRKYLPELPDYGAPLTIRQVLSHTSGLRDWYGVAEVEGLNAYEHHFRNEDLLEIASRQRALNFPSGSEYLYSNTGWNLMALIIERVSGESFEHFAERRLFAPLGMTHTRWREDFRTIVPGRAAAYTPAGDGYAHQMPFMSVIGAGGLLTTVHDLLLWNDNLSTGRVGGKALVSRMQQRSRVTSGREIAYGLGLAIRQARGTLEVAHGGATGGYRSYVLRYPERGFSLAMLCNEAGANTAQLAEGLADVFFGAAQAQQAGTADAAEVAAMRGLYRRVNTDEPFDVTLPTGRSTMAGARLSILRRDASGVTALLGTTPDGDSIVLERVAPWAPTTSELRALTGRWHSDEALATWTTALAGDTLVLQGPGRRRIALRPSYRDAFVAPGLGAVRFRRDGRGKVTEMSFLMGRVRDLRLQRISN